jgi:hypothetical protein
MTMKDMLKNRIGAQDTLEDHADPWLLFRESIFSALQDHPEARLAVAEKLKQAIEPEPCPTCGRK